MRTISIIDLVDALEVRLTEILENIKRSPSSFNSDPEVLETKFKIFKYMFPNKQANEYDSLGIPNAPDLPGVVIRPHECMEEQPGGEDGKNWKVRLIFGIEDENHEGLKSLCIITEMVANELLKKRTLADQFRLNYPIKTVISNEMPWPVWLMVLETTWNVPQIEEEFNYHDR